MFNSRLRLPVFVAGLAMLSAPAITQAATCDAWFTQSQSMSDLLTDAFGAMNSKDATAQATLLPRLDAAFNALAASEIAPETCGNHINAYTSYQYTELNVLRAHNVDSGFPVDLPIVKQPALNHESLAYATGWMKYEKEDYTGALAAYAKGLKMFPHSHQLQQEYLATLMQLKRYQDVVDFAEQTLNGTFDLDDEARAKVYAAHGMALYALGNMADAKDSFVVAQRYSYSDDVADMLDSINGSGATQ